MCGIAGYIGRFNPAVLTRMSSSIAHRGPDGRGEWYDNSMEVGLAHRRLSIIDTTDAASQPMISAGGRYITVFNGEIYNFRELNAHLVGKGYSLNPNSDTSCLAPLYGLYGVEMLRRLNGMFAFAIWDTRARVAFLARDHAGIKPLYYAESPNGLLFASELKALLATGQLREDLNEAAIHSYLTRLWSPGPCTPLANVLKLCPGEALQCSSGTSKLITWSKPPLAWRDGKGPAKKQEPQSLLPLFDKVVSDQCVSDVPVGAFLSGGVDSSAVVASMIRTGHRPSKAYCIAFESSGLKDEGFGNDLTYAQRVAQALDVDLVPIIAAAPTPADLERMVWMLEEPQADVAPIYVEQISRAARQDGVPVLLSGVGGDDIFSGYRRHRVAALRMLTGDVSRRMISSLLGLMPTSVSPLVRRIGKLSELILRSDKEFLDQCFNFNDEASVRDCLATGYGAHDGRSCERRWYQAIEDSKGASLLERVLYMERYGFLPDHNLNYSDKASMWNGIEVRVPFLDPRLIDFAATLPSMQKINRLREKWFLKEAMRERLPPAVLKRNKTGFGGPVRIWTKSMLGEFFADTIRSESFRSRGLFNPAAVDQLLDSSRAGKTDGAYLLLALTVIELWMRQFTAKGKLNA